MRGERLGDRRAHPHPRVEGVVGILEHDLHGPPVVPQLPAAQPGNVRAVEADLARRRGTSRSTARPIVLLPEPLSPTRPRPNGPGATSRLTPSTARTGPKRTSRPAISSSAAIVSPAGGDSLSITGTDRSRSAVYGCSGADMI